jgi:multidrug efflux pump subunit AcrB
MMVKLSEFSVKNSLLVNLVSVFIIVTGSMAMLNLNREAFPTVDFDEVAVRTYWIGAPAEDVEKLITLPVEKEIRGISGIKEFTSVSEEGFSLVAITIDPDVKDKRQVVDDIETAVDRVTELPEGINDDPVVTELKSEEWPVLDISIGGDLPSGELRVLAERLEDLLLEIKGVASVTRVGWQDQEIWVELDPRKMIESHVSLNEVMTALRERNITIPGGPLAVGDIEYNVRISAEFATPAEIAEVVVRANDAGNWLKIKDIATVRETFEDAVTLSRINGKRNLTMVVVKSADGDIVRVVELVKKVLSGFEKTIPEGVKITTADDMSFYVERRLGVLKNNGIIGFVLVVVLLFIFLDPLPALVTAFGIPIALFVTFIAMQFFGIAINLISMLGLIIVLGMLVDDGIIVAENVFRYREQGMPIREAVIIGTQEVIMPVTVTILTTCAAFAPLLAMTDIIGKFIREIPLVVMIALGASLLEAFIILPSHLFDLMTISQNGNRDRPRRPKVKKWFKRIQHAYIRFLNTALNHRYLFFTGMIILLGASIFLATRMKIIIFTGEGVEEFSIRAEAPKGTSLESTEELMVPVESLIDALPRGEIDSFRTTIGKHELDGGFDPSAKRASHLAQIRVYLTPAQQRRRSPQEIGDDLREQLESIEGFEKLYVFFPKEGPPVGRDISVGIRGDNWQVLQEIAGKYTARLGQIDGVSDIETTYTFGKKQLRIRIDEAMTKRFSLSVDEVARAVSIAFRGGVATTVKPEKAEEETAVRVRFAKEARAGLAAFEHVRVRNRTGQLVPLLSVAEVVEDDGIFQINHLDGKRVIYVQANVNQEIATSLEVNRLLQREFADMSAQYPDYTVKYSGEFESQMESQKNLLTSFTIAFLIIFMILATMFNSLVQPFIVMLAIPFGLIGVVFAFYLHGRPLSFFGMMGVVGLTGIVVNDSIVLVDFINRARGSGKRRRHSLIQAGKMRLRPVIMTSLTTIGGLVSVAYGIGGGDPFLKPMALAIVYGLLFSTVLILVMIPCVYEIIDDLVLKVTRRELHEPSGLRQAQMKA